jgi:Glycosyltransferase family 87
MVHPATDALMTPTKARRGAARHRPLLEHPHAALFTAAAVVLVLEGFRGSQTIGSAEIWPILQALVAGVALSLVWRRQERLRLAPLLGLACAFQVGWIVLHLALGVHSDFDSAVVYPREGNALLHGRYPSSEYPPGATLLFALESLVSGGSGEGVRTAHAFLMVPFELATVAGIWLLRTRYSGWFAAVVALWPLNAFFTEFKFDPAPTAALVVGLVLALRGRWLAAGIALGLGADLKWTPGLAAVGLMLWLLCSRRRTELARHVAGFAGALLLVNVPFLVVWPHQVLHAYHAQEMRGITGESFPYLVLRLLGRAQLAPGAPIWSGALVPSWAVSAATVLQVLCVLGVFAAIVVARGRLSAAVAMAALIPVAFLLTVRTFSPQYLVTILAAWAVAASLLARSRREQLVLAAPMLGATLANVLVYPTVTPTYWWLCSWILFVLGFLATLWLVFRGIQHPPPGVGISAYSRVRLVPTARNERPGRNRSWMAGGE